ncbi:MAG TPA: T9SS type A sorting domain-containing protein, partial [Flavobacterium sp.]
APSGIHRQLLLGADELTTDLFDLGYDAPLIDSNVDDMHWSIANNKFIIQAVPDFNIDRIVPFGIKTSTDGEVTLSIASLENILELTNIYIHDNLTGEYFDIKDSEHSFTLTAGEYEDRYSLRFTSQSLANVSQVADIGIEVLFNINSSTINIRNKSLEIIESVELYNMLGQKVMNLDVNNSPQENLIIPLKSVSAGTYIVKVTALSGIITQKIIIK